MLSFSLRWAVAVAALPAGLYLTAAPAQAQSDPDGSATGPTLQYRSVLEQYRGFKDQPVTSWVEVNDTVGKIGGWRVYAKEARQPDPAAATDKDTKSEPAKSMPGSPMNHGGKP
ncbi:MAG: hypothetical protein ACREVW_04460 [Burkholderiales bacterium]